MATAAFLTDQLANGSAYVIGEAGLTTALHEARLHPDRRGPGLRGVGRDAHVLLRGHHQCRSASYVRGADHRRPTRRHRPGRLRARCLGHGSVAAMITTATNPATLLVGKPNPMMLCSALNRIEAHSESTVMVGDRMDTVGGRRDRSRTGNDPRADRVNLGRGHRPGTRFARTVSLPSIAEAIELVSSRDASAVGARRRRLDAAGSSIAVLANAFGSRRWPAPAMRWG